MLRFPWDLQYLIIVSDMGLFETRRNDEVNHGDLFKAIRKARPGGNLRGLRFDMMCCAWIIVPAPGLHRLPGMSHVEMSSNHISPPRHPDDYVPPDIQYPPECLLPLNLEVLEDLTMVE
jgi:hypothetical protein